MDITQQELKTMKAKQLRKIIREAIEEVLAETATIDVSNPNTLTPQQQQQLIQQARTKTGKPQLGTVNEPVEFVEGELAEMAMGNVLSDKAQEMDLEKEFSNLKLKGIPLSTILAYVKANPGATEKQIATEFGFERQQPINALMKTLRDKDIISRVSKSGEPIAPKEPKAPGEEDESEEVVTGPEAFLIGKGDLDKYFSAASNDNMGDEEDFNAEEEPTAGEIGGQPISASSMSDEDYDAFMKYDDLKQRLDATKSNIIKMKRSKGGTAGDIKDKPSTELLRLRDLKKSLEDKINALVASSDYLKKKTGQEITAPEIEPIEDEDELTEGFDKYEIRKMQFYAGIRK